MTATRLRAAATALPIAIALALGACGSGDDAAPAAVATGASSPGEIHAGQRVPLPTGEAVLRVRGVARGNDRGATAMDLATLERLPRLEVTIDEPFEKRSMTFTGVRVTDLLDVAGAGDDARRVFVHALDDYHVRFRLADLERAGAILATRADGKAIPLEQGGPIRIVFPTADGLGKNKDNWIWSVDWMRVS